MSSALPKLNDLYFRHPRPPNYLSNVQSDKMAAIQCRDCISGSIHTGKPAGTEIEFHGLPTYVTRPDEGKPEKGIIVFIPDIFGWKFANSRLLADKFAKKGGYTVYLPDFMRGESINHLSSQIFTLYQ
jgi:hypothetical protein